MSEPLLSLDAVTIGYGGGPVVKSLDLHVDEGEIVCLLGANGVGKTTTLLAISGLLTPSKGTICFESESLKGVTADAIVRRGLVQVPEDRSLFGALTVRENLRAASRDQRLTEQVLGYFPALSKIIDRRASVLSGGEQQMLVLARALVLQPKLLLVDEMSLGLAPIIVESILPIFRKIVNDTGCSILMVEQHVHLALEIADRAYVMARGEITKQGTAADISAAYESIRGNYLGTEPSGIDLALPVASSG